MSTVPAGVEPLQCSMQSRHPMRKKNTFGRSEVPSEAGSASGRAVFSHQTAAFSARRASPRRLGDLVGQTRRTRASDHRDPPPRLSRQPMVLSPFARPTGPTGPVGHIRSEGFACVGRAGDRRDSASSRPARELPQQNASVGLLQSGHQQHAFVGKCTFCCEIQKPIATGFFASKLDQVDPIRVYQNDLPAPVEGGQKWYKDEAADVELNSSNRP
ncbi:unnamed protein product [Protopolystoma xenopodis]|uniref:Uncharacterized protein n=1 Tax=Protopolystoma xenopodis TaxID=117903 RepID=A0A3S5BQP8_9PLAT|nr:unnamed protein product [Protopolystoma xenopodis]